MLCASYLPKAALPLSSVVGQQPLLENGVIQTESSEKMSRGVWTKSIWKSTH